MENPSECGVAVGPSPQVRSERPAVYNCGVAELNYKNQGVPMRNGWQLLAVLVFILSGCSSTRVVGGDGDYVVVKVSSRGDPLEVAQDYCDQFAKSAALSRSESGTGTGRKNTYRCR